MLKVRLGPSGPAGQDYCDLPDAIPSPIWYSPDPDAPSRAEEASSLPSQLQGHWLLRHFGERLLDPRLWALHRRAITGAFGVGIAICFIPLPVHLVVAVLIAIAWRLDVPAIYGTTLLVNPITVVPMYYLAYRVGAALLGWRRRASGSI